MTRSNLLGLLTVGGVTAVLSGSNAHAQQQDAGAQARTKAGIDNARAEVTAAETDLARAEAQLNAAIISVVDVVKVKSRLSEARIRLNLLQKPQPTQAIQKDLTDIITYQEKLFETVVALRHEGVIGLTEVMRARRSLAEARIRFELYGLVASAQSEFDVALSERAAGIGNQDTVTLAKTVMDRAYRRFAANEAENGSGK